MRLKVLVPIREHVQHVHPPLPNLVQPLRKHFHVLLDLYRTHFGVQINGMADQINSNLHNIHNILLPSLHPDNPELVENIYCIFSFNSFSRLAGHGRSALMDHIPPLLPGLADPRLHTSFTIEVILTAVLASQFYNVAGGYYHKQRDDIAMSLQFFDKALTLARDCANVQQQARILNSIALTKREIGDYSGAQRHAREAQKRSQICGNIYQEAMALNHQALCYHAITTTIAEAHEAKSEYTEARNIHASIAEKTSAQKVPWNYALSLLNIASIDVVTGKPAAEVCFNLDKAKEIFTAIVELASLTLRERNIPEAKTLFQDSLNSQWGKDTDAVTRALERLANVSCWPSDEIKWSSRWAVVYLAYAKKVQRKVHLYKALQFQGDGFMLLGDEDTAQSLFEVALEAFTGMDIHRSRGDCMLRLGDIEKERGDFGNAVRLWTDARPLFERSLQANEVAKIDTRLAAINGNALQH
ncbi:hypothetical protein FB451DRAFT_1186314 [Mycena latifolia]|nr:hypothetical protein FB451DRAFT_1186314 [Mycena latifolia]